MQVLRQTTRSYIEAREVAVEDIDRLTGTWRRTNQKSIADEMIEERSDDDCDVADDTSLNKSDAALRRSDDSFFEKGERPDFPDVDVKRAGTQGDLTDLKAMASFTPSELWVMQGAAEGMPDLKKTASFMFGKKNSKHEGSHPSDGAPHTIGSPSPLRGAQKRVNQLALTKENSRNDEKHLDDLLLSSNSEEMESALGKMRKSKSLRPGNDA